MNYRREIDGLRAVAVLPVILFHAGFEPFSGGFVGVDVFFVISGYLITSIILAEKATGTFSLVGFYERRVRRILPALLFVMLACSVFAWFWMLPNQLREFAKSLVAVSLFASNILFWRDSGYFAPDAELNPLLHTWSLALEEQYYVLFPLFIVLFWGLGKKRLAAILAVVGVVSLALAEWGSLNKPAAAFYLLPTRGWELAIGAMIAFFHFGKNEWRVPALLAQSASFAGLVLIAYAVFAFDKSTRFPSIYALAPTLGAALIILFATPATVVGRVLAHPGFVGIGLISYSAYLWHQPLFAFARTRSFGGIDVFTMLIICSLVLAYLTWLLVERPFRNRNRFTRKTIFATAATMSAALVGVGLLWHVRDGFPERISPQQREMLAFRNYPSAELYRSRRCLLMADQSVSEFAEECDGEARSTETSTRLFLWGDSFAAHLYPGLKRLPQHAVQQYTTACPPLVGLDFEYGTRCNEVEEFVLTKIKATQPDVIVLAARWGKHKRYLTNFGATLERLQSLSRDSKIVVIGAMPEWEPSLPEVLARAQRELRDGLYLDTPSLKVFREIDKALMTTATLHHASFVSPISFLCQKNDCLVVVRNGDALEPIAYDHGHLTARGMDVLMKRLAVEIP